LNIGYVNRVACFVEGSRNRHLFAVVLLCILLIIEEMPARFAIGRLACEQGKLSGWEFYDLARECLICLLGWLLLRLLWGWLLLPRLLGLWLLLPGVVATLGSQARGGNAEGRRKNQCERLSRMIDSRLHIFIHYSFTVYLRLRCDDRCSAKVKILENASPLESIPFLDALLAISLRGKIVSASL
jgi:hypothetical protein